MGVTTAPVAGSGSDPAWIARVENPRRDQSVRCCSDGCSDGCSEGWRSVTSATLRPGGPAVLPESYAAPTRGTTRPRPVLTTMPAAEPPLQGRRQGDPVIFG